MKRRHDYSQNFLRNPKLVKDLLGLTSIAPTDLVYDIGAGSGIISSTLAEYGCQVIAVEPEEGTAKILKRNTAVHRSIEIIEADFLSIKLSNQPYKVLANIPFHISAAIVRKLTTFPSNLSVAYLITQKQFSNRLLPDFNGPSSQLGMMIGPLFSVRNITNLRSTDFQPQPNVDITFMEISARDSPLIESRLIVSYQDMITKAFSDPDFFNKLNIPRRRIHKETKPSDLSLSEWIAAFLIESGQADYS